MMNESHESANNLHAELQEFFERENALFELDAMQKRERERAMARTLYTIVERLQR